MSHNMFELFRHMKEIHWEINESWCKPIVRWRTKPRQVKPANALKNETKQIVSWKRMKKKKKNNEYRPVKVHIKTDLKSNAAHSNKTIWINRNRNLIPTEWLISLLSKRLGPAAIEAQLPIGNERTNGKKIWATRTETGQFVKVHMHHHLRSIAGNKQRLYNGCVRWTQYRWNEGNLKKRVRPSGKKNHR